MPATRLQRVLARVGVASRRKSEELIRAGKVRVNGQVAELGMNVDPSVDVVTVGRRRIRPVARAWIALHKPEGYVVSRNDARGRPTVFELVPPIPGLTYVGRLDVDTSGLLLMTTDGEAANRLTHPRYGVERAYRVLARGRTPGEVRDALSKPIRIDGREVGVVSAQVRSAPGGSCQIRLVLVEGRNRIVRRMCRSLGLTVDRLTRLSHGPVRLGRMQCGNWRYLTKAELGALRLHRAGAAG